MSSTSETEYDPESPTSPSLACGHFEAGSQSTEIRPCCDMQRCCICWVIEARNFGKFIPPEAPQCRRLGPKSVVQIELLEYIDWCFFCMLRPVHDRIVKIRFDISVTFIVLCGTVSRTQISLVLVLRGYRGRDYCRLGFLVALF